jgi:type II secretory pathway pseudopilin PulG
MRFVARVLPMTPFAFAPSPGTPGEGGSEGLGDTRPLCDMITSCFEPSPSLSRSTGRGAGGGRGAFTLVEVLVTLLFLAIVLPVAMRGVSISLAAASNARHTREATSLAQEKLQELTTVTLPGGSQSGDFGVEHPEYRWMCQVSSLDYGVRQLDLRVTWEDRGERAINVSTLFAPDLLTGSGSETGGSSGSSGTEPPS